MKYHIEKTILQKCMILHDGLELDPDTPFMFDILGEKCTIWRTEYSYFNELALEISAKEFISLQFSFHIKQLETFPVYTNSMSLTTFYIVKNFTAGKLLIIFSYGETQPGRYIFCFDGACNLREIGS